MTAGAETRAEVLAPLRGLLAELKLIRHEAGKFVDPGTWAEKDFVPTPVVQLLERLTYLLGLSDLERAFFEAGASDEMMDAFDGRLAYADWLEEGGHCAGAARVRGLSPKDGDVLVWWPADRSNGARADVLRAARFVHAELDARGTRTAWVVMADPDAAAGVVDEAEMAAHGWVPAGQVAEEREACARIAEGQGCERTPALIRARGDSPA